MNSLGVHKGGQRNKAVGFAACWICLAPNRSAGALGFTEDEYEPESCGWNSCSKLLGSIMSKTLFFSYILSILMKFKVEFKVEQVSLRMFSVCRPCTRSVGVVAS